MSLKVNELVKKGDEFRTQGKLDKAMKIYEEIIKKDKNESKAWYGKGFVLFKFKRYEDALDAFEKVNEIDPDWINAWYNKGVTLLELRRYEDALKTYNKIVDMNKDDSLVWNDKGFALATLGRYTDAEEAFKKAVDMNPNNDLSYANLAELYLIHGDLESASDNVKKALNIKNENVYALMLEGRIHIENRKYDDAIESFQKAARYKLGNPLPLLWIAYARYLRAESCFKPKGRKYKEEMYAIIRDLEKAHDLAKEYPQNKLKTNILYYLGYFYYKNGDIFAAKERLEDCMKLESKIEKLEKLIGLAESPIKQRTCDLLNYIWDYEIKPTWWRWWLFSPTCCWLKRTLFFLIIPFIPILLLFYPLIPEKLPYIKVGWHIYSIIVLILILILLLPDIEKIKVKDVEIELRSPPLFEPFLSPLVM